MATLYNRAGEPTEVPDEQAQAALASGQFGLPKGRVNVLTPEGDAESLPSENVLDALGKGYALESAGASAARLEAKQYDRPVEAFAAGAARGASFGLSDLALTKTGLVSPERLEKDQKYNKVASIAGEATGVIGSAFVPGLGEATAGKLAARVGAEGIAARALGEGIAGRVGGAVAKGAAEGSLFGIGNAISEASLGDTDLTAEKLVAGAGIGALTGGVLSGALHGVGEGVGAAVTGFSGSDLQGALSEYADQRTIKAIAGNGHKAALKELEYKGLTSDVAKHAIDEGILTPGATAGDIAERAAASVEKHGRRIGGLIATGDAAGAPRIDGALLADRIESELVAPAASGNVGQQAVAKRLQAEADIIRAKGSIGFQQATDMMKDFRPHLDYGAEQKPIQEGLKQIVRTIKEETETQLDAATGLGDEYLAAKRGYRLSSELRDLADERVTQLRNNRSISPSDYGMGGVGAVMAGGPVGLATGLAGAIGNKLLRERGPQLYASILQKVARSGALEDLAQSFQKQLSGQLEAAPQLFGSFRNVLAQASARSAEDLLATHVALSRSPDYRDQMAMAGYGHETPEQTDAAMGRLGQLQQVKAALEQHDQATDIALNRFLGKQSGAPPAAPPVQSRDARLKEFDAQAKRLTELATNPGALAAAVTPHGLVSQAAPGVAAATSATAARALQYLQGRIPRDPHPEVIPALKRDWKPSESDLLKWGRTVQAVNDPRSVLADLKRGTVSREQVDALRAVYPRLLQDLQQKTMEKLAAHDKPVTYAQRQGLATLMGSPTGGAGNPARAAVFQQAHAAAQKAKAQADAHQKMKIADGMATASQRIEGR